MSTFHNKAAPRSDEVDCKVHVGIPRMDLDTEETRETQNLYIEESTRGSLKNIILKNILFTKESKKYLI